MKGMFWFLILVLAVLFGLLIFNFTRERTKQAGLVVFELNADSIRAYELRVEELEQKAGKVRDRIARSGPLERLVMERRLGVLEGQIRDLKTAIAQWRAARESKSAAGIYRQCILLYGKASGICDLLMVDTLPLTDRQK